MFLVPGTFSLRGESLSKKLRSADHVHWNEELFLVPGTFSSGTRGAGLNSNVALPEPVPNAIQSVLYFKPRTFGRGTFSFSFTHFHVSSGRFFLSFLKTEQPQHQCFYTTYNWVLRPFVIFRYGF